MILLPVENIVEGSSMSSSVDGGNMKETSGDKPPRRFAELEINKIDS